MHPAEPLKRGLKKRQRHKALILVVICTIFTATGQFFYKLASERLEFSFFALLTNTPLLLGLFFYFVGAMLMVFALKHAELSTVYPFISLTFIWVFIIGVLRFGEVINPLKLIGTATIVFGVGLIGRG